jgi:heptose-I-phosphate ethanolaminephosphotransferase
MSYNVVRKDFVAYRQLKENIGVKDPIITADSSRIDNIVLVIGESLNRNHMGVYGYDLPTTPKLSELSDAGNIVLFSDVVSPSTGTIDVIQRLLTFYNYEKPGKWYDYDILIDVMRKAGYKTFWISNQESFGTSGNLSAALATRCDYSAFCDVRNSNQEAYGDFDEHIFPLLDSLKRESSEKNLFIIHLMGSHVRYLNRYPKGFEKFSARDEDIPYADYKKQVRAEYDNSVLYNDSIVGAIVSRFVADEALLIYLSDHAEEVYDIRDYNGRSIENLSKQMVEIPFMIWMSDSFIENFPQKKDLIEMSSERPYMTDDLIHTILDITDISTNDYEPCRSVISPEFDADRTRRIGEKDYDKL